MKERHNRVKHLRRHLSVELTVLLEIKVRALFLIKNTVEEFLNLLLLSNPILILHVLALVFHVLSLYSLTTAL